MARIRPRYPGARTVTEIWCRCSLVCVIGRNGQEDKVDLPTLYGMAAKIATVRFKAITRAGTQARGKHLQHWGHCPRIPQYRSQVRQWAWHIREAFPLYLKDRDGAKNRCLPEGPSHAATSLVAGSRARRGRIGSQRRARQLCGKSVGSLKWRNSVLICAPLRDANSQHPRQSRWRQ
jgi:hypothetical protein